jgi:GR25 family glycosyltransferase involved in LPS biosynthesis
MTSVRHTFLSGRSLYVHRGFFVVNDPIAPGVDTTWIINLDRRPDRLARTMMKKALRFPAIDGQTLKLTPDLVRMFSTSSSISWRKGVMACALSHISLWMKLVADKPDIQSYLILEDDAVLAPECIPLLTHINDHKLLPADCDVLYLGGILPPNKERFPFAVERVNDCIGRVKENTLFSETPSRYFHFCAYSYILRRSGAEKLCAMLKERGCWAPADHLLCNSHQELNLYCTTPLVAGCYQDTDPRYAVSNFNVFGKEEYDSDLRNEDVFIQEEVLASTAPGTFSLERALGAAEAPKPKKYPLVFHDITGLFEKQWLEDLLGKSLDTIETNVPIVLYQRPYCNQLREELRTWPAFTLLHLSDEGGVDPIDLYSWPACKGVVRNYVRKDLPKLAHVVTIPLGYHWTSTRVQHRDLLWSFIGAEYGGRKDYLRNFKAIEPNKCVFQPGWNSPTKCDKEEYTDSLQRSLCVPCPGGANYETFRIYEALEAGAVPLLVEEYGSAEFLQYIKQWIPLATSPDWPTAARVLHGLTQKPDLFKEYRKSILLGWASMKQWASTQAKTLLQTV